MFFAEMSHSEGSNRIDVVVSLPFDTLERVEETVKLMLPSLGAKRATIFTYFRRPDCTIGEIVTVNAHGGVSHTRGAPDSPAMLAFMETRRNLGEVVMPQRYIVKTM